MVRLIGFYADKRGDNTFDLANKLQFLTLDIIGLVGFGKSFGLLDVDADPHEFGKQHVKTNSGPVLVCSGLHFASGPASYCLPWKVRKKKESKKIHTKQY